VLVGCAAYYVQNSIIQHRHSVHCVQAHAAEKQDVVKDEIYVVFRHTQLKNTITIFCLMISGVVHLNGRTSRRNRFWDLRNEVSKNRHHT